MNNVHQFSLSAFQKFSAEGLPENFRKLLTAGSGYSEPVDFESLEPHFDAEISEGISASDPQEFLVEYIERHWEKFGEIFYVN